MDFALPEIGEGVYEAELTQWLVKPGDAVKRGQNLLEVMTDKATMEVPAPFIGAITELKAEPGEKIKVGQVILSYTAAQQPAAVSVAASNVTAVATLSVSRNHQEITMERRYAARRLARNQIKAAPSVRYLARKLGIDLSAITKAPVLTGVFCSAM